MPWKEVPLVSEPSRFVIDCHSTEWSMPSSESTASSR
jgi:hypothetical protein